MYTIYASQVLKNKWKIGVFVLGSLVGAFLFSVYYSFQWNAGTVNFHNSLLWKTWVVATVVLFLLFYLLDLLRFFSVKVDKKFHIFEPSKKEGYIVFLVILTILLLVYLALYPGWISYDGPGQIAKYMVEAVIDSHHPVLHTLLMIGCVQLGITLFQSATIGFGFYTLIQMLIVAFALSVAFIYIWKWTGRFWVVCISHLLIFCNPVFLTLVMTSAHDIIFGAFFLLTIIYYVKLLKSEKGETIGKQDVAILICCMILSSLFEKQGIYIYIVVFFIGIISYAGLRKKLLSVILLVSVVTFVITGPIYGAFGVISDKPTEKISVPLLQLTRVVNYAPETLTEKELEIFYQFVAKDRVGQYEPAIADSIKVCINRSYYAKHKSDFFKLWFQVGLKNPGIYLDAFVALTEGYFYPGAEGVSKWGFLNRYLGSGTDQYTIEQTSFIPALQRIIVEPGRTFYRGNLLLSFWVSISFVFWMMFYAGVNLLAQKDWDGIATVLFNLVFFGTLLLGPVSCIRYVFPMLMCTPLLLSMTWKLDYNMMT